MNDGTSETMFQLYNYFRLMHFEQNLSWESIFGWNTASSSLTAENKLLVPWQAWFPNKRRPTEMTDGTSDTMFQQYDFVKFAHFEQNLSWKSICRNTASSSLTAQNNDFTIKDVSLKSMMEQVKSCVNTMIRSNSHILCRILCNSC